ncbi:FAD-dependent urate hydroxylase HpxO [soil metagenome]
MDGLRVIVIGAGMGGMTTALALKQAGYHVEVYEQAEEIRPIGAGISLWSNGVKCLNRLGLASSIAAIGGPMDSMAYRDSHTGDTLTHFSLQPLYQQVGQRAYPVARAELQDMLIDSFGRDQVHLGAKFIRHQDHAHHVTAYFEDGRSATADLLVAADGTHSFIREYVLGSKVERRYAGYVNWNGLVPITPDLGPATSWITYLGDGQRVSMMPVARDRFYFFFDAPLPKGTTCSRDQLREELRTHFAGWAPPVQHLIDQLDPLATNRIDIHDIEPFFTLTRGRVVLVGDAGHSTVPDLGQGGCQAMEDAIVLADMLKAHTLSLPDSLHRYQELRKHRVADLVLKARKRCDVTHGKDMATTRQWYAQLRTEDGTAILQAMARNIQGGPLH